MFQLSAGEFVYIVSMGRLHLIGTRWVWCHATHPSPPCGRTACKRWCVRTGKVCFPFQQIENKAIFGGPRLIVEFPPQCKTRYLFI